MPVSRRGTLIVGESSFPCMVLDMSDSGFLLMSSRPLAVGQVLGFRCELFPNKLLECRIEIRYTGDAGSGARITEIDDKGATLCKLYLQEHFSDKLTRSR